MAHQHNLECAIDSSAQFLSYTYDNSKHVHLKIVAFHKQKGEGGDDMAYITLIDLLAYQLTTNINNFIKYIYLARPMCVLFKTNNWFASYLLYV